MAKMQAAVITRLGQAPKYQQFQMPVAQDNEGIVRVLASSLKQLDRAIVAGLITVAHHQKVSPLFVVQMVLESMIKVRRSISKRLQVSLGQWLNMRRHQ